ncbi:MAG: hypothetical protein CSA72_13200 [Rhodobacterales bacterium]|nr:MAG: hypothetical protein CSA72_13200 [Rhodobacterales bacterium]
MACEGVPEKPATDVTDDDSVQDDNGSDDGSGISGSLPPKIENAKVGDTGVARKEENNSTGGGYVSSVEYEVATDRFIVDNLAFDGGDIGDGKTTAYTRDPNRPTIGGYAQYRSAGTVPDDLTGATIDQYDYRALYGASKNSDAEGAPRTQFAIVRTGDYANYGFGGFVYQRRGGVVLPEAGQVKFSGDYAGVRIFSQRSGLELVEGKATAEIDFDDFNAADAVRLRVIDRIIMDRSGAVINYPDTALIATIVGNKPVLNADGEMTGPMLVNSLNGETGAYEVSGEGTYYGVLAGDLTDPADKGELAGVIVVEYADFPDVEPSRGTVQETGGFILYRP